MPAPIGPAAAPKPSALDTDGSVTAAAAMGAEAPTTVGPIGVEPKPRKPLSANGSSRIRIVYRPPPTRAITRSSYCRQGAPSRSDRDRRYIHERFIIVT